MIYSFIFTSYPFQYLGDDDVLVAQMIGFVEELPKDWHRQWVRMRLNSNREVILEENSQISKLERRFKERVHDPELAPLFTIIRGLVRFLPSSRMEASEALDLLRSGQTTRLILSSNQPHGKSSSSATINLTAFSYYVGVSSHCKPSEYQLLELPRPEITDPKDVIIKVHAASVNPVDLKKAEGVFKIALKDSLPYKIGYDAAGTVVEIGTDVSRFKVGDSVYVRLPESHRGTTEYRP
ncbi:hypothetical protein DTO207G8_3640 [Paecilomyces variotii]|nr:hypothetical protein DTO207G8_3640 [Paecilomyces variotii]